MKVYITKYALTQGILVKNADKTCSPRMIRCNKTEFYHGNDWHESWEEAVKRAEEMRDKKIVSLKKSLENMEYLKFEQEELCSHDS